MHTTPLAAKTIPPLSPPLQQRTHFCPALFRAAYTARTRSGGDCTDVGDRRAPSSPPGAPIFLFALESGLENGSIGRFTPEEEEPRSSEVTVLTILFPTRTRTGRAGQGAREALRWGM